MPTDGHATFDANSARSGRASRRQHRTVALPAVTFVSSTGAHDDRHRGLVLVHRDVELTLAGVSSLAVTNLRAPFFLENLAYFLPAMKARGATVSPIAPDALLDAASTADVARAALRLLTTTTSRPHVHELRRRGTVLDA